MFGTNSVTQASTSAEEVAPPEDVNKLLHKMMIMLQQVSLKSDEAMRMAQEAV